MAGLLSQGDPDVPNTEGGVCEHFLCEKDWSFLGTPRDTMHLGSSAPSLAGIFWAGKQNPENVSDFFGDGSGKCWKGYQRAHCSSS